MASRKPPVLLRRPAPRLYLVTPVVANAAPLADQLSAMLAAADVAAVLLRLAASDERTQLNTIKTLAPVIQGRGTALVLHGQPELVARAGADGAHLTGLDDFTAALPLLKPDRIAGCGGLATRHDAMLVAETGADYVMFGEPDADGRRPSFDAIVERVEWWAEVFEVPCVGYAADLDEIAALAMAGADFVAVGPFVFAHPRGPATALQTAADRLSVSENAG